MSRNSNDNNVSTLEDVLSSFTGTTDELVTLYSRLRNSRQNFDNSINYGLPNSLQQISTGSIEQLPTNGNSFGGMNRHRVENVDVPTVTPPMQNEMAGFSGGRNVNQFHSPLSGFGSVHQQSTANCENLGWNRPSSCSYTSTWTPQSDNAFVGSHSIPDRPNLVQNRLLNMNLDNVNVVAEQRRLFQPYDRNSSRQRGSRPSGTSTSRARQVVRPVAVRELQPNFSPQRKLETICLLSPDSAKSLVEGEKLELAECGLGGKFLHLGYGLSSEVVQHRIRELYPPLGGTPFELLRAVRGGWRQPLVPLVPNQKIPSAGQIFQLLKNGRIALYIRPLERLPCDDSFDPEVNSDSLQDDVEFSSLPRTRSGLRNRTNNSSDNSHLISPFIDVSADVLTLDELRDSLYDTSDVTSTLEPDRKIFLEWIVHQYSDNNFDIFKKPFVVFPGEDGIDDGALTREMFRLSYQSITKECLQVGQLQIAIFEGEEDHRVPVVDMRLVRNGTFRAIGRCLTHAAIHVGISLPGVSPAVAHYLCSMTDEIQSSLLTVEDIPDFDLRTILELLDDLSSMNDDQITTVKRAAFEAGFYEDLTQSNVKEVKFAILQYEVILKRKLQLDELKRCFLEIGLLNFLKTRQYLVTSMFPLRSTLEVPKHIFLQKIVATGNYHRILDIVKSVVLESIDAGIVKKLLSCWTGSEFLPDGSLKLKVVATGQFIVHACSMEMVVPEDTTDNSLREYLSNLCIAGTNGFGAR